MSKQQKLEDAKRLAEEEKKALLLKKASEAGLLHKEEELPPEDELTRKDVDLGLWYSIKSVIPWTDAYYATGASEMEMNDYEKIRIEKVIADDLLAKSKIGLHEEVLAQVKRESNRDFFFFNKLMYKEKENKGLELVKPNLDPYKHLHEGERINRLRRASRRQVAFAKPAVSVNTNASFEHAKKNPDKNLPCAWRGKRKSDGEFLECKNVRVIHPKKTIKNEKGEEEKEVFMYCKFHIKFCLGEPHWHVNEDIQIPNIDGFCSDCFVDKNKSKPPLLKPETVPGVAPVTILKKDDPNTSSGIVDEEFKEQMEKEEKEKKAKAIMIGKLTAKSICCWRPNPNDHLQRMYLCKSVVFPNVETKHFHPTCAYHVPKCLAFHPEGSNPQIKQPNELGLCDMHYTSIKGTPPPAISVPYPGMYVKLLKNAWKNMKGHWASPRVWVNDLTSKEYLEVESPDGFFELLELAAKKVVAEVRIFKHGPKAALIIQRYYRGYRMRNIHLEMYFRKIRERRLEACIRVQGQIRRFLRTRYMNNRRLSFIKCCVHIQSRYRGFRYRKHRKIWWAATRIQKFFKRLRFLKLKDTVVVIMQLKMFVKRKNNVAINIQQVWRGYMCRLNIWKEKFFAWMRNRYARLICKWMRTHRVVVHSVVEWKPPGDNWAVERCAKKLAVMLWQLMQSKVQRRKFIDLINKAAPSIQRFMRGFIGRAANAKVKFLRKAMRTWCQPRHAEEFLEKFLQDKIFYIREEAEAARRAATAAEVPTYTIRQYLPSKMRESIFVNIDLVEDAIRKWYEAKDIPCVEPEIRSIILRFQNSGKIDCYALDIYVHNHKAPCTKHCRTLCGECYFYKECLFPMCKCKQMRVKPPDIGICVNCTHNNARHRGYPLQCKKRKKVTLLNLLQQEKVLDEVQSNAVEGVEYINALLPVEDKFAIKDEKLQQIKRDKFEDTKSYGESINPQLRTSLVKQLVTGVVEGDQISGIKHYWDPDSKLINVTDFPKASIVNAYVETYQVPPDVSDVTESIFWSIAAKNPNKTLRDYHEKFEHSIPVPIIEDGKLVYTFEGPKIYYNILLLLIKMEKTIHFDNTDFLRLIMDNIQLFERHWRKMVADIRNGKLDSNLIISPDRRAFFENINVPRPALAKKLDDTFRELGFHKKVLGKDIKMQKFAELRADLSKDPRARRLSQPDFEDPNKKLQNFMNSEYCVEVDLQQSRAKSPWKESKRPSSASRTITTPLALTSISNMQISTTTLSKSPPRGGVGGGLATLLPPSSREGSSVSPSRGGGGIASLSIGSRASSPKRKANDDGVPAEEKKLLQIANALNPQRLKELEQFDHDKAVRGPSRMNRLEIRRGSDTDIVRPAELKELNLMNYNQSTAARSEYSRTIITDNGRYICPFPACGQSFKSKDIAFTHLYKHEQKTRLMAPSALPDSHMQFYWPEGVPWLASEKYTKRTVPPGNHICYFEGCTVSLPSKERLEAHVRLVHSQSGPSNLLRGYFDMQGACINVPPFEPPMYAPVKYCPNHLIPARICPLCVQLEHDPGPKPPFKFYDQVFINYFKKSEKNMMFSQAMAGKTSSDNLSMEVTFKCKDQGFGVYTAGSGDGKVKNRLLAAITDRKSDGWVCVRKLYNHIEAGMNGIILPEDADRNFEIWEDEKVAPYWIPIESLLGQFQVYHVGKEEFLMKRGTKEIKGVCFFIRPALQNISRKEIKGLLNDL